MTNVIITKELKMKKIAIATLLAISAVTASAVEVGVTTQRDYSQTPDRNGFGITVGQQYDKVSVTGGFERYTQNSNDTNRYSLVGGYDIAKFGDFTITPKIGVAFVDPTTTSNGWQGSVGVGASYAVNKTVSLTADYRYQSALQSRVNNFDGNVISAGVKVGF
jgi:opacity protein-like surface antigen